MEIKFGLENFLSWIKKVTEEFNFETDITIKLLENGSIRITEIDFWDKDLKKTLLNLERFEKVTDAKDIIVDNYLGNCRIRLYSETEEMGEYGPTRPQCNINYPCIYTGVEVDRIEFTEEEKKTLKEKIENHEILPFYHIIIPRNQRIPIMDLKEYYYRGVKDVKPLEEYMLKIYEHIKNTFKEIKIVPKGE